MNIDEKIKALVPVSKNINDLIVKLDKKSGGGIFKKIKQIIELEKLDTSHFIKFTPKPIKFKIIKKICSACKKEFETQDGLKHEKKFCSKSCANKQRVVLEKTKEKISKSILKRIDDGIHKIPVGNSGLIIAERAKILKKTCAYCNKNFSTNSAHLNQICCSQSCSSKFSWKNGVFNNTNFSDIQKEAYKKGTQKVGGGKTKWFKYNDIKVQGTYEFRTCFILDELKDTKQIHNWEYTKDRIKYIGIDNKNHNYLLDFKIWINEVDFYYLETKGYIRENDEIKWKTTREKGYRLDVWFLREIKKQENNLGIKNVWKNYIFNGITA